MTARLGVARTDTTVIGRWWWTVDRWSLVAVGLLIGIGAVLVAAASPAIAIDRGLAEFHFVIRHLVILAPAIGILLLTSMLSARALLRVSAVILVLALAGMVMAILFGHTINGATRWIHIAGQSLQPSEFAKPAFAVVAAWLFAASKTNADLPGGTLATGLLLLVILMLGLQPDLGMTVVFTAIWCVLVFLAGLPMIFVVGLGVLAVGGLLGSYFVFDHVQRRINQFLYPEQNDSYQIDRSLEAFQSGGLVGVGPGEGSVKHHLPDSHTDFIFAVAGEEFGLVLCLAIVGLFAFLVMRSLGRLSQSSNPFVLMAGGALAALLGLQALINMGSTLGLIPTKGMALPLISYGGSSTLANAFGLGMLLAFSRRDPGLGVRP